MCQYYSVAFDERVRVLFQFLRFTGPTRSRAEKSPFTRNLSFSVPLVSFLSLAQGFSFRKSKCSVFTEVSEIVPAEDAEKKRVFVRSSLSVSAIIQEHKKPALSDGSKVCLDIFLLQAKEKSARRESNPRPSPWQGDVVPLYYSRITLVLYTSNLYLSSTFFVLGMPRVGIEPTT